VPTLLGQRVPGRALFWCGCATVLGLLLRLMYPLAALMLGRERGLTAGVLVGLSVLVAALAGGASSRAIRSIRPVIFRALASAARRQPYSVGKLSHAEVESEIARGAPWVEAHIAKTLPGLIGNLLAFPIIAVLSAQQIGIEPTLAGLAALAIACAVGALGLRWSIGLGKVAWRRYHDVSRLMERGVRGAGELRVHGLGERYERAVLDRVSDWTRLERRASAAGVVSAWSIPAVTIGVVAVMMSALGGMPPRAVAAAVVHAGRGVVVGGLLVLSSLPVLLGLARTLSQLGSQRASLELLERFVARQLPERGATASSTPIGTIRVRNAILRYPASTDPSDPVLEIQAQLEWRPGVALALQGPTGAGKTSVLHLVAGLVEPMAGSVEVEQGARTVGPDALVGNLVYVPQQAYFDDLETVREAIRFMAPDASDQDILRLLRKLTPGNEVLPADLERTVGSLSAGQRRVVAITRGLLRSAPLLMIDEPELNLDPATCSALAGVLRGVKGQRRLLIATHDETLASVADVVAQFDGHLVTLDTPSGGALQPPTVEAGGA